MVKILLVCSAGMSTSLMVNKMKGSAKAKGIEAEIWAVSDAEAADNLPNADILMLGPQVRFLESKMKEIAGDKPSISSTSGFSISPKNCLAEEDKLSTYLLCPSA